MDSQADTCLVGSNVLVVHDNSRLVDVYDFEKETQQSNALCFKTHSCTLQWSSWLTRLSRLIVCKTSRQKKVAICPYTAFFCVTQIYQKFHIPSRILWFVKEWLFYDFYIPSRYRVPNLPSCIPHFKIFADRYRTHTNLSDVYRIYTIPHNYWFVFGDVDSHFV